VNDSESELPEADLVSLACHVPVKFDHRVAFASALAAVALQENMLDADVEFVSFTGEINVTFGADVSGGAAQPVVRYRKSELFADLAPPVSFTSILYL
jgi:hypothetical protein